MGNVTRAAVTDVVDDAIWVKRIDGAPELRERIVAMKPGEVIDLEIDGVVGPWERMRTGKDGRPTLGIKPIAEMREVWARLRHQGKKTVTLREVVMADNYLAAVADILDEWNSPEDDEAFRDL
jgi:hypothetical protein